MGRFEPLRGMPRWLILGFLLVVSVAGASGLARISEQSSDQAAAEELRDGLVNIRSELDACMSLRSGMELRFEELERDVQRLRREVDSLENADARGVPAESYPRYLELVEAYNRAIPEWERAAADLQARASQCRSLAEIHNARADSLRRFLVESGIWSDDWRSDAGAN